MEKFHLQADTTIIQAPQALYQGHNVKEIIDLV